MTRIYNKLFEFFYNIINLFIAKTCAFFGLTYLFNANYNSFVIKYYKIVQIIKFF